MDTKKALELIDFIHKSPSVYHVIDTVRQLLTNAGFTEVKPSDSFSIMKPSGAYFTVNNGSCLLAWRMQSSKIPQGFRIIGTHSDSPCLRIKPNPEISVRDHFLQLNTEVYGGPILSTWFDRPLSLAGRVVLKSDQLFEPKVRLVSFEEPILILPNLAIHMNREVNEGYKIDRQKDLLPVISILEKTGQKEHFLVSLLAKKLNVPVDSILDFDLYTYDVQKGTLCGLNNEFFSVGKIDNLGMAYASIDALISEKEPSEYIRAACIFDNEEVGSSTKQGAASPFLSDSLKRMFFSQISDYPQKFDMFQQVLARSFCISADQAHGFHPNYPEKNDITNFPLINQGPVIKVAASMSYASDGISSGVFKALCKKAGVPCQEFVNRSDIKGGSTIGPITVRNLNIKSIDIGNALWSMHSVRELGGTADQNYITRVFRQYYQE